MSNTPNAQEVGFPGRKPFIDTRNAGRKEITMDAATVDSGNTPTNVLRRGLVLAKKTGLEDYIDADDATANANGVASALSSIDVGASWTGETITIHLNGGSELVSFAIVGATAGALKTELEAVAAFAANYTATVVVSKIRIDSRATGADQILHAEVTVIDAFGAGAGLGVDVLGTYGEFGISEEVVDTVGIGGTAIAKNNTIVYTNARVDTARITSLTTDARRALEYNGFKFE